MAPAALLAVAYSTFVLASTPFLLDLVTTEYSVGLAMASLIGVAQLGGFVVGSWGSGRFLRPTRSVFVATLALAMAANLASTLLPPFALLIALRFCSGLALGLIAWFAWAQVFGDDKGMGDIAIMGPIAGMIAGPLIAAAAVGGGAAAIFATLAALAVVPLVFSRGAGAAHRVEPRSPRSTPVPAAAVILVALGLFTLGGSAVFQYAVVLGTDRAGLAIETIAIVFSLNALAGMPAAKWPWRRGIPGPWMAVTGICAIALASAGRPSIFAAALMVWGFAFWMAVPGVFTALAERSANPADRAGDAQAIMAVGRVVGPFVGGLLLDLVGAPALGLVGGGLMLTAGAAIFAVRNWAAPRSDVAPPPVDADSDRRGSDPAVSAESGAAS